MKNFTADLIADTAGGLGEGPFWDAASQRLLFVDIEGRYVGRLEPRTGTLEKWPFAFRPSLVTTVTGTPERLLVGGEQGIGFLDTSNGEWSLLCDPEADRPDNRFNDGACDHLGNLWAGTMSLQGQAEQGALYRISPDGNNETAAQPVTISNGIDWSPDRTRMYYIDTPTGKVDLFTFDPATGQVDNRRTAFVVPEENGRPDGCCVDAEGMLWVAHFFGRAVRCYHPDTGEVLATVDVAAKNVTSCCFGGPDLEMLYITTARIATQPEELETWPHAGGLFACRVGVKGLPQHAFGSA